MAAEFKMYNVSYLWYDGSLQNLTALESYDFLGGIYYIIFGYVHENFSGTLMTVVPVGKVSKSKSDVIDCCLIHI